MTPKIFGYFAWKRRFNPRGFSPHFVGSLISAERQSMLASVARTVQRKTYFKFAPCLTVVQDSIFFQKYGLLEIPALRVFLGANAQLLVTSLAGAVYVLNHYIN